MSTSSAQPIQIQTERLLLRPPTIEDAEAYYAIASDPEYAYFGGQQLADRETTTRTLARILAVPWQRRPEFAIVMEGRVVGRVMLDVDRSNLLAALAYGIARPHWGRGVASEAARATVDYAFEALGLAKLWARVDPRNAGSVRVLERLGMQCEGLMRSHLLRWGERVDRAHYGLLREEWQAARTSNS